MIIGKGPNSFINQNNSFQERLNTVNQEGQKMMENAPKNPLQNSYTDVENIHDMREKSFQMLDDRFHKGLISLEEYQRQCAKLNKIK